MSDQRGAAAVELALVATFLVLLATGVADIGRAVFTNLAVQDAAQEGVFFASFEDEVGGSPLNASHIRDRVRAAVSRPQITDGDIDVACYVDASGDRDDYEIEVTVRHTVDMVTPIVSQFIPFISLEKTARAERFDDDCPSGATVIGP